MQGKKTNEVYEMIKQHIQDKGYAPTVREITDAVGLSSTSVVHFHLRKLRAMGLIRSAEGLARAITLTEPVERKAKPAEEDQPRAAKTSVAVKKKRAGRQIKVLLIDHTKGVMERFNVPVISEKPLGEIRNAQSLINFYRSTGHKVVEIGTPTEAETE